MKRKQTFLGVALAGVLAAGCLAGQGELGAPTALAARTAATAEAARVVRVVDGDTYVILSSSTTFRLRLLGVDAPEHDQAFGPQAADSVARLLPPGRVVLVVRAGMDLYGRTLGTLLLPTGTPAAMGRAVPLDSLLVARGWAWAFDPNHKVAGPPSKSPPSGRAGDCGNAAWAALFLQNCGVPSTPR